MTGADSRDAPNRRPLTSRSSRSAQALSRVLIRSGISPNAISVLSVGFAVLGAVALIQMPNRWAKPHCVARVHHADADAPE